MDPASKAPGPQVPSPQAGGSETTRRALRVTGAGQSVCVFTLGRHSYALDTAVVGEVITVDALLPVPRAPPQVLGLYALRGTPVALVNTCAVLALEQETQRPRAHGHTALVVRTNRIFGALWVDRVEAVWPWSALKLMPRAQAHEHAAVAGLVSHLEAGTTSASVTLISHHALLNRLIQLRFR